MKTVQTYGRCCLLLFLLWQTNAPAAFDENEKAMIAWIDAHSEEAISLMEKSVNISSGTLNFEGVRAVGDVMRAELDALGLATEWIDMPAAIQRAGHLIGRQAGSHGRKLLLIGHLDTVFEADDSY